MALRLQSTIRYYKHTLFLLCFVDIVVSFFLFFLLQSQGLCQRGLEKVYRCHISNSICSLGVSVTRFGKSPAISKIFILIIFVMMT